MNIVYGPFESIHFGRVLGINLLGAAVKACSFDCGFCHLGPSALRLNQIRQENILPSLDSIKEAVADAFKKIHAQGPAIDFIQISGNGEPTLHHEFAGIAEFVRRNRDLWLPEKKIQVFSNGSQLGQRKIVLALNELDERVIRIDAGNENMFKKVNAPLSRTSLSQVLDGIRRLKDVSAQCMFVEGPLDNTTGQDLDDWMEAIALVRPRIVYIQTVTDSPWTPGLLRCDEDTLYTIASKLERRTGLKSVVLV